MSSLPWIIAVGAVLSAPEASRPGPHESYELVTVADGVYAFIAPEGRTGTVQGNSVAVIGSGGGLVVDTGQFPELTRRMIADIRKLTDKPVRFVVNTHWHGDHLLGNRQYREAFPGVVILQHAETRRLANAFYPDFVEKSLKEFPTYVSNMRAAVERGHRRDGTILSGPEKEYYRLQANELEAATRQLPEMAYTPADLTFEQGLRVHLGSREVQILHVGRGNTSGDTVVYVPDAKVAIAGDLVVSPTPYSFGSWLEEWPQTLRRLTELGATRIVPGHGPILEDTAYIDSLIDLIQETRRQVRAAVQEGLNLEDTRKKVDLGRYRRQLAGEDYWRGRAFDEFFLEPAVGRAFKEAKGEPLDEALDKQ